MNAEEIASLLTQGGVGLVAIYMLGRIVWKVGERMISQIDALTISSNASTAAMTKAIADSTSATTKAITDSTAAMAKAITDSTAVHAAGADERAASINGCLGQISERIARVESRFEVFGMSQGFDDDPTPVENLSRRKYPAPQGDPQRQPPAGDYRYPQAPARKPGR